MLVALNIINFIIIILAIEFKKEHDRTPNSNLEASNSHGQLCSKNKC